VGRVEALSSGKESVEIAVDKGKGVGIKEEISGGADASKKLLLLSRSVPRNDT